MKIFETENGDLTLDYGSGLNFANFLGLKNYRNVRQLYKYSSVNEYTINALEEGYLWFSKPLDFNDPYDCLININYSAELENKHDWLKYIDNEKQSNKSDKVKIFGDSKYIKKYSIDISNIVRSRDNAKLLNLYNHMKHAKTFQTFNETTGVCCFTTDPKNILMWSHYGNNHKGICLKFRTTKNSCFYESQYPIQYLGAPIKFKYKKNDFINELKAFFLSIYSKSNMWSYESEWRNVKTTHNGRVGYDKKDLMEIIFGVNTPEEDIEKVIIATTESGYTNIKYKRIKMELNKYVLRINGLYNI